MKWFENGEEKELIVSENDRLCLTQIDTPQEMELRRAHQQQAEAAARQQQAERQAAEQRAYEQAERNAEAK